MQQEIKEDLGNDAFQVLQIVDRSRLRCDLASILELPYGSRVMDRVFCLSVLEHLPQEEQLRALTEFRRVMKSQGLMVLTFDYPAVNMAFFQYAIRVAGLKFAGPVDFSIRSGGLTSPDGHLRCFRAILRTQQEVEDTP
jgi:predicted SAM-dependent methyltransferase